MSTTTAENPIASPSASPSEQPSGCCAGMEMPQPTREHQWLQQFVGEWESDLEAFMDPSQPPMKSRGESTARMHGGFWLIEEGRNTNFPYAFILTLGYDPEQQTFVGTWADTMMPHLWHYRGSIDPTGKILTLETEGPCPGQPGRRAKFREVTEFKSPDHRVFTSSILGEDGKWATMLTVDARRKK